ncbi:MAG: DUF362 domain-containing protein [Candidatus Schekmanbacteria bacterium]|nr:MAG: DUF362 domain-containing protein [Candidatus Schekmanbacteria bacterium]
MKSKVSLIACPEYEEEKVISSVREAVGLLGGFEKFISGGNRVLIKPNLLSGKPPEKAVTTHPTVLSAVIDLVREAGGIPVVGDSPATEGKGSLEKFKKVCEITGILDVVEKKEVELVHFSSSKMDIENPDGKVFKKFTVTEELKKCDVHINLCKLKTHGLTLLTGAVKNNFGCVPGLLKGQLHMRAPHRPEFSQMLVDLYKTIRPALSIMDAVVGMDGNGPGSGNPRKVGAIIASTDAVALDSVACQIIKKNPYALTTCKLAEEQGVGVANPENIEILGDDISKFYVDDYEVLVDDVSDKPLMRFIIGLMRERTTAKPVVDKKKCTGCKTCYAACVPGAITMVDGYPVMDYNKCIKCYCCHEVCPEGAINLKKGLLYRLLAR